MPRKAEQNPSPPASSAAKERKLKVQPATPGPKRRARVALTEIEDIVREVVATHRYTPWLDTEGAAKYLCRKPGTLKGWRSRGEGPAFRFVNDKLVRYHVDDLDAFVRGDGDKNLYRKKPVRGKSEA